MNPVNKILLGIGAAVVFVIVVAFICLSLANAHLKTQLAEALANGTACHLVNDDFAVRAAEQNRAVAALQTESAAREKKAKAAVSAAQKAADGYLRAAEKIRATKKTGDACVAAMRALNDYAEAGR